MGDTTHYYGDDCETQHYSSQFFITEGINEVRVHEAAQKYQTDGKATIVHYHRSREECNDQCKQYLPEELADVR